MKTSSPSEKQLKEFGLLIGFLFPFLIGWLLPTIFDHGIRLWTIFVGLPLIILGLFFPNYLKFFYKKWISIGNSLAFVNSHIVLGFVFIVALVPISFIMKLFKYDPLKMKKDSLKTFREVRKDSKVNLEKIF
ncbi:Hypothetical protein P9215_04271 [Prochlorococcus marinus str. MIT 9215]|uniref:SxtJ n=1 Tax=Prochlorococcus marinus (strain MIT 9215) TaxID=93060 RepID=A8G362_PROM2|nr:SxtJ family membrane protein [Prochlorococcus marinus]ABV50043.1 Hypothetical protein P9215_04271 [Prochlorococcus marinus str. MIT 9215]